MAMHSRLQFVPDPAAPSIAAAVALSAMPRGWQDRSDWKGDVAPACSHDMTNGAEGDRTLSLRVAKRPKGSGHPASFVADLARPAKVLEILGLVDASNG